MEMGRGYLPGIELMDDGLEPDDGKETGREATDPGQEENGERNQTRVAGVFRVFGTDATHLGRRFLLHDTLRTRAHGKRGRTRLGGARKSWKWVVEDFPPRKWTRRRFVDNPGRVRN